MISIKRVRNIALASIVILGMATVGTAWVCAAPAEPGIEGAAGAAPTVVNPHGFYAVAITMGCACLAAAYAVGKIGAAVMGAAAEHPELTGRGIIFVAIGEGIAVLGFVISLMLALKL